MYGLFYFVVILSNSRNHTVAFAGLSQCSTGLISRHLRRIISYSSGFLTAEKQRNGNTHVGTRIGYWEFNSAGMIFSGIQDPTDRPILRQQRHRSLTVKIHWFVPAYHAGFMKKFLQTVRVLGEYRYGVLSAPIDDIL